MFAWLRSLLQRRAERRHADADARHNRDRGTHCFYCGAAFSAEPGLDRTVDHRHPHSKGGTDALVNMVFACRACNERKADRDEAELLASEWLADRRRALGPGGARR